MFHLPKSDMKTHSAVDGFRLEAEKGNGARDSGF